MNRYHRSAINISAPRTIRRSEYEAGIRSKTEEALKFHGKREVAEIALAIPDGLFAGVLLITLTLLVARSTTSAIEIAFTVLAFSGAVTFMTSMLYDLVPRTWLNVFITALAVASGAWAAQFWINSNSYSHIPDWPLWKIAGSITLIVYGAASLIALISSILYVRWNVLRRSQNLDGEMLLELLAIYHLITVHRSDWGKSSQQAEISTDLSIMATCVQRYLPQRLGAVSGMRRRELRSLAFQIAAQIRNYTKDLFKSDGRKDLIEFTNLYTGAIYQGAWLELPRAESEGNRLHIAHFVRPLAASLVPAVLVIILHIGHLLPSRYEPYGWLFAALWFAASVGAWIDPDLGERLKVLNIMASFFTPKSG